jgi:TonB family protein
MSSSHSRTLVSHDEYLVTLDGAGGVAAPLHFSWDGHAPLPLGHPTGFVLEKTPHGDLRVRDLRGPLGVSTPVANATVSWQGELAQLQAGTRHVRVRRLSRPGAVLAGRPALGALPEIPTGAAVVDPDARAFRKLLQITHGVLLALISTALLWPSAKGPQLSADAEKLIPAQYAKLLMAPKPKVEEPRTPVAAGGVTSSETVAAGPATPVPTTAQAKVANTAVVRAFRAKALQSAVHGLLKGGMTTLLAAEGKLLVGADSSGQIARAFENAPVGDLPTAPFASAGDGRGVNVATLGGGGGGGVGAGAGTGVGYGAGRRAAVEGQGSSFVSLDIPGAAVEEGLSKEEVGKVIHAHISEIRYCYESSILRSPDLEGKLVLDFAIGADGLVKTAAVKESSLNDPRLDDCILRRLTKWSFPKPNGGVQVAVSYPFLFKALKR